MTTSKTNSPCKINVNTSRLRNLSFLDDLAALFIPHKSGSLKRDAFIKIWMALRDAPVGSLPTLEHLKSPTTPLSTICKVRKEMRAIGLIDYRDYSWRFSPRLASNLRNLAERISEFQKKPPEETRQKEKILFAHLLDD